MNLNMNVTIRRLMSAFAVLFLAMSGIAAYVQIGNQAFYNGPVLAHGQYDSTTDRNCPPYDAPVRGTIYDRNGVKLAWSVQSSSDPCVYIRKYDPRVYPSGLAPLLGYFSSRYGTSGVEQAFNDQLAGVNTGQTVTNVVNSLLHKPLYGQDVYLTIDINLQVAAAKYYQTVANGGSAFTGGVCQNVPNPPGSIIAEDPNSGEILAMVSFPSFDPNQMENPSYVAQENADPGHPFLNHATAGLYTPGSTFKTMTLLAALDAGQVSLDTQYDKNTAVSFQVPSGETITWQDYFTEWQPFLQFPMTLEQGFALSDNSLFARLAVNMGGATWLSYARKFGIAEPGFDVPAVPFDVPEQLSQSSAYEDTSQQKQILNNQDLLAESGFGQGKLFISPLTMVELSSTIASSGQTYSEKLPVGGGTLQIQSSAGTLYDPHVVMEIVPRDGKTPPTVVQSQAYTGGAILRPETTTAVRQAMWAVVSQGTAFYGLTRNGQHLSDSPVKEGGKTGTAQSDQPNPETWWISLAPDDAAPGGSAAKLAVTVMKENGGEGACQVFVADDTYAYAMNNHVGPYGG
jgi:penicillin-binding protein A